MIHALELGHNSDLPQRCLDYNRLLPNPGYKGDYPHANEPYFVTKNGKPQNHAELGYCWEQEVFRGQIVLG